jgi:protein-tyrosine phosphatase
LLAASAPSAARVPAEYGSRRGWALHHASLLARCLGAFYREQRVDFTAVQQLIFVCRGNICRSPYAARRARAASMRAFSCGLDIGANNAVDPLAAEIARRRGLNLDAHHPRGLDQIRISSGDLIVAMEPAHLRRLRGPVRKAGAQLTLLGLWSTPLRPCLADPFGLSEEYCNRCFMLIDAAIAGLSTALSEAKGAP